MATREGIPNTAVSQSLMLSRESKVIQDFPFNGYFIYIYIHTLFSSFLLHDFFIFSNKARLSFALFFCFQLKIVDFDSNFHLRLQKFQDDIEMLGAKLKHHQASVNFLKAERNRLDDLILDIQGKYNFIS